MCEVGNNQTLFPQMKTKVAEVRTKIFLLRHVVITIVLKLIRCVHTIREESDRMIVSRLGSAFTSGLCTSLARDLA